MSNYCSYCLSMPSYLYFSSQYENEIIESIYKILLNKHFLFLLMFYYTTNKASNFARQMKTKKQRLKLLLTTGPLHWIIKINLCIGPLLLCADCDRLFSLFFFLSKEISFIET